MGLLELFILAVGLSMDAFAVSVCKGLAMPKITVKKTLIVGVWFGGFQALMPTLGYFLGVQFRDKITAIDHWIAFILLGIIGANMIKEACSGECEEENDNAGRTARNSAMQRVRDGGEDMECAVLYSEYLSDYERIGDHLLNIAQEYASKPQSKRPDGVTAATIV